MPNTRMTCRRLLVLCLPSKPASAAISRLSCICDASLIYAAWCLRLMGSFTTDSNASSHSSSIVVRSKVQTNNNIRSPTLTLDTDTRCCFCVCPSIFSKILCNFPAAPSRRNAHLRVLRRLSSNLSISIIFDIVHERLLRSKYMLKENPQFHSLALISFPLFFVGGPSLSPLSPPLHLLGL